MTPYTSTRSLIIALLLVVIYNVHNVQAQLDYSDYDHWLHHPQKPFSQLRTYNLDVAVIDAENEVGEVITIPNRGLEDTGVDIFWVHPTFVDPASAEDVRINQLDELPAFIIGSIALAQGGLLAEYGRFYAPRYRQATAGAFFTSDGEAMAAVLDSAYQDVKAAFLHYLEHENNGNHFILAGHSQGSYHLSFLLHDVIEQDSELANRLVMAALGGMSFMYAAPGEEAGGNCKYIRHCQTLDEQGCYVTWKSFRDGVTPIGGGLAVPGRQSAVQQRGLVYRTFDREMDRTFGDTTYYNSDWALLDHYIIPVSPSDPLTPSGVRFAAYNDYYEIRHQRFNDIDYGHMVGRTYDSNDQRADDLAPLDDNPLPAVAGYHQKDYNIYIWALKQQVEAKLAALQTTSIDAVAQYDDLVLAPNPATDLVRLYSPTEDPITQVTILRSDGTTVAVTDNHVVDVTSYPAGTYYVSVITSSGKTATEKLVVSH